MPLPYPLASPGKDAHPAAMPRSLARILWNFTPTLSGLLILMYKAPRVALARNPGLRDGIPLGFRRSRPLFRARHPQRESDKCSYSKLLREEKLLSAAEGRVDKSCRGQQPEAPDCGWAALRTEVRATKLVYGPR